jgi:hypothetical protein
MFENGTQAKAFAYRGSDTSCLKIILHRDRIAVISLATGVQESELYLMRTLRCFWIAGEAKTDLIRLSRLCIELLILDHIRVPCVGLNDEIEMATACELNERAIYRMGRIQGIQTVRDDLAALLVGDVSRAGDRITWSWLGCRVDRRIFQVRIYLL